MSYIERNVQTIHQAEAKLNLRFKQVLDERLGERQVLYLK